jgi:hypothetical protein
LQAAWTDPIAGGRLQLEISRGSPEQVIEGWRYFGCTPLEDEDDTEMEIVENRVFHGRTATVS